MLKLFLLIPFITLNVAMTLGLIYFTVFIDTNMGIFISFFVILILSCALVLVYDHNGKE